MDLVAIWSTYVLPYTVFVLGREEGYTVQYTPSPEGVCKGKAQGNL